MKAVLLRLAFWVACMFVGALPLRAQIEWQRVYGGPFDDGCEVRALDDGGFAFISSIGGIDTWLVRTDPFGDTLWSRRIAWADFCSLTPTQDGGFFLVGTTRTQIRNEAAYKVDALGDSVWAYIYADSNDHGVYRAEENQGHGLLITGYMHDQTGNYDMWVRQIDESGLTQWAYSYGTPGMEFGAMPAMCPDGGYLFATTQDTLNTTRFFMVRTDAQGAVLWQRSYSPGMAIGGAVPTALPNGGFLLIGWIQLPGNNYNSFIVQVDSAGLPAWNRHYGGLGFEDRTANGVVLDQNGGYTFCSMTDQTFGPDFKRDIALVHLDTLGVVQRIRRIGYPEDEVPRFFCQGQDGGYAVIGYTQSFTTNGYQAYLVKVAALGCDENFYWPGFPEIDTICPGSPYNLDAGPGFSSYLWSTGDTGRYLNLAISDTVFVMSVDSQGCKHYSNWFRGMAMQAPQFTWTASGLTVQFDGSVAGDWDFGDGSTQNSSDPAHTYSQGGTYLACLSVTDPVCGVVEFCDSISVSFVVSRDEARDHLPQIFPVPASNVLHVQWETEEGYHVSVVDLAGRVLAEGRTFGEKLALAVEFLPQGAYLLICESYSGKRFCQVWLK
jgi:hypothetical protein